MTKDKQLLRAVKDIGIYRYRRTGLIGAIQHAWSRLQCIVYGHHYRPFYVMQGSLVQYRCECCYEATKWMNKTEHAWFNIKECPTWGDRGEDSQGYRFVGPIQPPERRRFTKREKARYKRGHRPK